MPEWSVGVALYCVHAGLSSLPPSVYQFSCLAGRRSHSAVVIVHTLACVGGHFG